MTDALLLVTTNALGVYCYRLVAVGLFLIVEEVDSAPTTIIANPTHVAVAPKYAPKTMAAPVVLAKGYDEVA